MATFVLIHGAAGSAWDWHRVGPELRERGHDVVAVNLPCDDDSADFSDYADTVVEAIGDRRELIVVAHSLGGFTAPIVCERVPTRLLVLVAGMIPSPGERPADWWGNTGFEDPEGGGDEDDLESSVFLHDVPRPLAKEALKRGRSQSGTPMERPWPLEAWPKVRTRVLLCRDDRFFPPDFMRRVARERLGIEPDELDGGHYVALSRPKELAERLDAYAAEAPAPTHRSPAAPKRNR